MIYPLKNLGRAVALLIGAGSVTVAASETNAPSVNLSVNNSTESIVYRGWPMLLRVEVLNEALASNRSNTNSQTLSAASSWVNALQTQLLDANGQVQPLNLHLATDAALETLELTANTGGEVDWWVWPEDTARLSEGTYQLKAILNTTNSPSGWLGVVRSTPVLVKVANEPAALDLESLTEKWIGLAELELWRRRIDEAEVAVAQLLALQGDNLAGLVKRGDLLQIRGRPQEALAAYHAALVAFNQQNPTAPEPFRNLVLRYASLQTSLRSGTTAAWAVQLVLGNPAALCWPGRSGEQYSVEASRDLKSWSIFATNVPGADSLIRWPVALDLVQQFFRVRSQSH